MSHRMDLRASLGALNFIADAQFTSEIVVVSGENGSGKTTLLRCLAGLESTQGLLTVHGQVWLDSSAGFYLPVQQRLLGCLWTNPALLPWLTVEQNIMLGATPNAICLQDLSIQLQIEALLQRSPAMLSSGEAQRVALARAVYRKPKLLLLDEPFSAQAPTIRQHLRLWLATMQKTWAIPIIMVSHDTEDAQYLAQQHWHMRAGKIIHQVSTTPTSKTATQGEQP